MEQTTSPLMINAEPAFMQVENNSVNPPGLSTESVVPVQQTCKEAISDRVVESFTRKLLDESDPRRDACGQGENYAHEFELLLSTITNNDDLLYKACFAGDEKAISKMNRRLKN